MGRIHKLDNRVVNQIAAGEVVIQPCSVIKELVENAIDAGASRIEVDFSGSGAEGLYISDNGCGMDEEDLKLCLEPHATSKINGAEDLYKVVSCGFRGEALASIAEVAQVEITSATRDGGALKLAKEKGVYCVRPASRGVGTTISVKELFYNVPVRRRFLKSERAEVMANMEALKKLALARPWIGFKILRNGKKVLELKEDSSLETRARELDLFNHPTAGESPVFEKLEAELDGAKISGLFCLAPIHYPNAQKIFLFVNHRPFGDRALAQAAMQGMLGHIPERRYPAAIIKLDMDPEEVDVNIHPTKSEVRFRKADQVFRLVHRAFKKALEDKAVINDARGDTFHLTYKTGGIPKTVPMNRSYGGLEKSSPLSSFTSHNPFVQDSFRSGNLFSKDSSQLGSSWAGSSRAGESMNHPEAIERAISGKDKKEDLSFSHAPQDSKTSEPFENEEHDLFYPPVPNELPPYIQFLNRYILIEKKEENLFEVLDQHAVHERILFNQLYSEDKDKRHSSQLLFAPISLLQPAELQDLSESSELWQSLEQMGYRLSPAGEKEKKELRLTVEGYPSFLKIEKAIELLERFLDEAAQGLLPDKDRLRHHLLATTACKAAIKAGDRLTAEELRNIVAAYLTTDCRHTSCPHGRSAIWRISVAEANNMFNR